MGFCTGALAAVTISCSRHVSDLLSLGPFTVRVAFRTALSAYEVAASVAPASSSSWAMTVTGMKENEMKKTVEEYCSEKVSSHFGLDTKSDKRF